MTKDSGKTHKYVFITGGVLSGLGKGILAASLGRLLKARSYSVTNLKFDAYINIDPGTMSLSRHGEVFITGDGGECDLDIGHYERFIDENLPNEANVTMGKIYQRVIQKERDMFYEGTDVQVIPHITDEIKSHIRGTAAKTEADISIVEIGGTVGDIENMPIIEAARQMLFDEPRGNVMFVHLTLVPYMEKSGEMKSKPTQQSVKELLSFGIQPDLIVCRAVREVSSSIKEKIALFCNVRRDCVIQNTDADSIYDVPLQLEEEGFARLVCEKLAIPCPAPDLSEWISFCDRRRNALKPVNIALVGKYADQRDAYLSVCEAINHAATALDLCPVITWVAAESLEKEEGLSALKGIDGIIIPAGFGERGVAGMINAAKYARENKIPCFGIGMGMHCMVTEFARNVLGRADAKSAEYGDTTTPIVTIIPESKGTDSTQAMRRGNMQMRLTEGTLTARAYGEAAITERHRHRYEVNSKYRKALEAAGLCVSAVSQNTRIEGVELKGGWHIGVQFHPEFLSRPNRPHPMFKAFVAASLGNRSI